MPFKSQKQAGYCYASSKKGWNCDEWASKTKWCQIPYKADGTSHTKSSNCTGKECKHFIKRGSRGGYYFDCPADGHKVYLPHKMREYVLDK